MVCFCVNIVSYDFYSTVIQKDYGSTVGLIHFKYFQTWEMTVLIVTAFMFTNLKQKFWKLEVITANVGNQLKLWYMRSCIQFFFRNLELNKKKISATLVWENTDIGWLLGTIINIRIDCYGHAIYHPCSCRSSCLQYWGRYFKNCPNYQTLGESYMKSDFDDQIIIFILIGPT